MKTIFNWVVMNSIRFRCPALMIKDISSLMVKLLCIWPLQNKKIIKLVATRPSQEGPPKSPNPKPIFPGPSFLFSPPLRSPRLAIFGVSTLFYLLFLYAWD